MSQTARLTAPGGAAAVAETADLSDDAKAVLKPGASPRDYLDALLAAGLAADAVQVLAACLPAREAVWWASKCAAQAPPPPPEKPSPAADAEHARAVANHQAALTTAQTWVARPTDEHRRAAFAAAEAGGKGTPAGLTGVAAFFAEGSLGPPNVPPVAPPPGAYAKAAAGAVQLAAVRTEPQFAPEKLRRFITLGLAVEAGSDRWPETPETAPSPPPPASPPTAVQPEPIAAPPVSRPTAPPPPPPPKKPREWY